MAIPVILDTDIGSDIDDTWALAMLLHSLELDLKLVTTANADTTHRAKIVARMLEIAGRSDIPIGIGTFTKEGGYSQAPWVAEYDLAAYPGVVHTDGVQALIDTIMQSPEQITVIGIGPLTNIGEALLREPRIAEHARFVGMQGSVYKQYDDKDGVVAEYNVREDVSAAQVVFSAPWEKIITPLDTCGIIRLEDERFSTVAHSSNPLMQAVMENYQIWAAQVGAWYTADALKSSSVLFDTVAVYLAFTQERLVMETLPITVTAEGCTSIDPVGSLVQCATKWLDLPGYLDFLVERLTNAAV